MLKNKILFSLCLFISSASYLVIRDFSNLYLFNSDSWIHGAKVLRYFFDNNPFGSPIFLEDFNHYFPLAYLTSNIMSICLNIAPLQGYGLMGFILKIFSNLASFIVVRRLFGNKFDYLYFLIFFLDPNFGMEYNPNLVSIFFIDLIIFLFLIRTINWYLILFFILIVAFTHIFFLFFPLLFLILFYFFKRYSFLHFFDSFKQNIYLKINSGSLLFIIFIFTIFFVKNNSYLPSEISIDLNNFIAFFGIAFFPVIYSFIYKKYLPIFYSLTAIYVIMYILYVSGFWLFHSQYFSNFFVKIILFPGTIIFFMSCFKIQKNSFFTKAFLCVLFAIGLLFNTYRNNLSQEKYGLAPQYKNKLIEEIRPYGDLFSGKVIFSDPGDYLNRFIVVYFNTYLYSVHYGGNPLFSGRPYTTIPDKLEKFPYFFHAKDRITIASNFITNPNLYTYEALSKYRIDYFVIPKNPKIYLETLNFLKNLKPIVGETKSYLIFKNF